MDKIITTFPTSFYISKNILKINEIKLLQKKAKEIEKKYPRGGIDWKCDTYNTLGSYNIHEDKDFKKLIDIIEEKTFEFTKAHGSDFFYKTKESWLNLYKKSDFQDWHTHLNSTFSAVYFLKSNKNCAKIYFENPKEPDMLPIWNIKNFNELNFSTYYFEPIENSLIIFRSYMRHMVEKQTVDFERMSVAVNL
jgi:uncharacterized protein (TIGR02466 family)